MSQFFFASLCLGIGLVSGFLGGLLGIGGGIVIVPALIILFDLTGLMPLAHSTAAAVATSLAVIVFVSLSAAIAQVRAGKVQWLVVRRWAAPVVLGAATASYLAPMLPVAAFRGFIGAFLALVAVVMLTRWRPSPHRSFPRAAAAAGVGYGAGLVSGIAGIGGGNVMVPTMIYFNTPMHEATATSSSLGVPLAAAGASGYILFAPHLAGAPDFMLGYLHLPSALGLALGAVLAAPLGVRLAHQVDGVALRRLFGVLLILAAARMLHSAWETLGH